MDEIFRFPRSLCSPSTSTKEAAATTTKASAAAE
jgi:hypothetical protein